MKGVSVMKYVINQIRKKEKKQMLSVVRLEIDYELVTLYDAMQENNKIEMIKTKERLANLVYQLHSLTESECKNTVHQ